MLLQQLTFNRPERSLGWREEMRHSAWGKTGRTGLQMDIFRSDWLWAQFAAFRAQPSYITASGAHMEFTCFSNLKSLLTVFAEKHSKRSKKLFLPLSAEKSINWSSVCSEAGLPQAKWLPSSQKQRLGSLVPAQVRISQQYLSIRTH